jgi:hypothetical protein
MGLPATDVLRAARRHGVAALLTSRAPADLSADLAETLRSHVVRAAAHDAVQERALREVLAHLHTCGLDTLIFKGADLAYSCYPQPHLRPRVDTDILVAEGAREDARRALERRGYRRAPHNAGDLLMYQEPYVLARDGGVLHTVDLHWRISNAQRFGDVASFSELHASRERRPRLGPDASGLSPMHAFGLACVHRVAHHFDDERLIWTYDLHTIAQRMTEDAWARLTDWVRSNGTAAVCARGAELTAEMFDTPVPPQVLVALRMAAAGEGPTRAYFRPGRHVVRVLSDVSLMPSWKSRARLIRQHVFPSKHYMRETYAPDSGLPVALLYVRRAWRGARRWMARA